MLRKISQKLVNEKCEILRRQNEEITVKKIKKMLGGNISIIDLVEKVTLYKENRKKAFAIAEKETQEPNISEPDVLLETIKLTLKQFAIEKDDVALSLRNDIRQYLEQEIAKKIAKLKHQNIDLSSQINNLELANIILEKRNKELLESYNKLKDDFCRIKQSYSNKSMQIAEKEALENIVVDFKDFRSVREQLESLKGSAKVGVYDKERNVIIIKFPESDFLNTICKAGSSNFIKAKTRYNYGIQAWELYDYALGTFDFLRKKGFVLSPELETAHLHAQKIISKILF